MSIDPTMERLDDQIGWYDRKSSQCQRRFKLLKGVQLACAGVIPIVASVDAPGLVAAALSSSVLVSEGFLQLNQYQQNWIAYRSTCEALRHEKYLFLAGADLYADQSQAPRLLAERVEGLVSQEHAKWTAARRDAMKALDQSQ